MPMTSPENELLSNDELADLAIAMVQAELDVRRWADDESWESFKAADAAYRTAVTRRVLAEESTWRA